MKIETLMNKTNLPGMDLIKQGKVRDIYEFDGTLLIVATDRISAFDIVMDDHIPDKGLISEKGRQKKWPLSWKTEIYRIIKTNGGRA
jgi:phosphoribosylaminoimidazole-succinocarboxamide synthase